MKVLILSILLILLFGCRTKAVVLTETASRHADSVAALRSIGTRALDREEVWECVVMLADSLGRLTPVYQETRRHADKATETTTKGDTAAFHAEAEETHDRSEKNVTAATETPRAGLRGFKAGVVVTIMAAVAAVAALAIWRTKK